MVRTLITGADGYLGRRIAARLLADNDDPLTLAVRAADETELAAKQALLRRELGDEHLDRVEVVAADVRWADPFAAVDPGDITAIVHAAACTAFNVEQPNALEVNVRGTAKLGEFARNCPKLERLLMLSTLFAAGQRVGTVEENACDGAPGFVNFYEWSKAEAERHLLAECADLPLSIGRLATIVADDETGTVTQHNVFHNTLKLFFYGLLSLMPGDPRTPLYLATGDFTIRGVAHLLRPETPDGVYHLAPSPSEVVPLGDLVDVAFEVFESDEGFRRRRLLRPEFCDVASFRDLVDASQGLSINPMRQALDSVSPFAEQMFLPKSFDNARLRQAWPGYTATSMRNLVEATCTHLVETKWGRTTKEAS